jgi:hypothetical protein
VATNGNDGASGTIGAPFKTIQHAADSMAAGDTCYIRGGRYREEISVSNKDELTFSAYNGETVVLDGSTAVTGSWTQHAGNIYKTTLAEDVWQLFADGEMMIPARWPNLAASGIDLSNAVVVLNIGSFRTGTSIVDWHVPGTNMFTYPPVSTGFKDKEHYYFAEGKLELLDAENEWFFDPATRELYAWVPGGGDPAGLEIRGKNAIYCFTAVNCDDLLFSGIDFFSGTFNISGCLRARVEHCDLTYPSCTRRMLRIIETPQTTKVDSDFAEVYNCTFAYTDGHGISVGGDDSTIENCYFHHIDYSCANLPSVMPALYIGGTRVTFRHNTLHSFGASVGLLQGLVGTTEYNNFYHGGYKQHDGAMVQVMVAKQLNADIGWNWVHDWSRLGIRFDGSGGQGGLVHHSVGWGPRMNSTVYIGNHENNEIINNSGIYSSSRNEIVVEHGGVPYVNNTNTITRNNLAPRMGGSNSGFNDVPGHYDHNWNGQVTGMDIRTQLRDPDNLDYRPLPGADIVDAGVIFPGVTDGYTGSAPDIGAYEYGMPDYWIPGHKSAAASMPIPPDGTFDARGYASLIWQPALDAVSNEVYLGTTLSGVGSATKASPEYMGSTVHNIYNPLGLYAQPYYWRIDSVTATGTVRGPVWAFTAANVSAVPPGIVNLPATDVADHTALVGGQVTDGGTASEVWMHWWPDGGATNTAYLGVQDYTFSLQLSGLSANTLHHYRCEAVNAYGTGWAPSAGSFTTTGETPPSTKVAVVHLPVVEDSWVQVGNNEGVNHDGESIIKIRGTTRFGYLKFDTGDLGGAQFDSAGIFIRTTDDIPDTSMHSVADNSWTAPTLTGSNAPPRGAIFDTVTGSAQEWIGFDTSGWITGTGVWSVALSTTQGFALDWYSEESGSVPYLAVSYISDTADLNANSIPDWWETLYFGHIVDNTDADLDGIDNYGEYVADTDPTNALSVFTVAGLSTNGAGFELAFPTSSNRNYAVKSTTNLVDGTWNSETNVAPGSGDAVHLVMPADEEEEFYRVEVSLP